MLFSDPHLCMHNVTDAILLNSVNVDKIQNKFWNFCILQLTEKLSRISFSKLTPDYFGIYAIHAFLHFRELYFLKNANDRQNLKYFNPLSQNYCSGETMHLFKTLYLLLKS